ncbi:MAG: hypothetical protein V1934_05520 [Methanobacteriota archaeon]
MSKKTKDLDKVRYLQKIAKSAQKQTRFEKEQKKIMVENTPDILRDCESEWHDSSGQLTICKEKYEFVCSQCSKENVLKFTSGGITRGNNIKITNESNKTIIKCYNCNNCLFTIDKKVDIVL